MTCSAAVLFKVALVVLLGRPESRRRDDLSRDRPIVVLLLRVARCKRFSFLLGAVREDGGAVLIADVRSLAIELCWIVNLPKSIEQLVVCDTLRIVRHFDSLGVPGSMAADLTIGRIIGVAARVPGDDLDDPSKLAKGGLHTPEAAGGKRSFLRFHTLLRTLQPRCWMRR